VARLGKARQGDVYGEDLVMTDADVRAQFDIVNPDLRDLSSYVGSSSLQFAAEAVRRPRVRPLIGRVPKQRRYTLSDKMQVYRMAHNGNKVPVISRFLQIPRETVRQWLGQR
jgi:hypothetical protein